MSETREHPYAEQVGRAQRLGLGAGLLGMAAAVIGLFVSPAQFFQGYLVAFVFWTWLSLGCLGLVMLHHLVAGEWGLVAQRFLESGALTIGLMAVLFIPILFGMHDLYEWTHADVVAADPVLQHKQPYLNVPFFIIRAVIYFAFWGVLAYLLSHWSLQQDAAEDAAYTVRLRRLAAGGLIGHVLMVTFASCDWTMSLDPHWFSTIYAWLMVVSQTLTALAVAILVLGRLRRHPPLKDFVRTKHFHDYGNLLLAFVILWSYMAFAQYLIVWAGNVPEDIRWYVERQEGGWFWAGPFLIVFHFAVPFFVLLSRHTKRSVRALSILAGFLLFVHAVYSAWLVLPSFHEPGVHRYWITVVAFLGIGGVWTAACAWLFARRAPLPRYDPRFEEMLTRSRAT